MKRQCLQKIILVLSIFCLTLSFFISAYADPFTGAYLYTGVDPVTGQPIVEVRGVNPTGQTFTGANVIEMNAYNNAPILTSNTFNGSTSIDPAFTDITSNGNTYNGTTTLTYDGVTGGNLESNNDTFATANVNTSNADVELNNPTFNGSTTLQADNISLGSISQMDTLNNSINYLVAYIINIKDVLFTTQEIYNPSGNTQALTISSTFNGVTVSTPLPQVAYTYYSFSDNTLTENVRRYRCGYWRSINIAFTNTINNIYTLQRAFIYNFQQWTTTFLANQSYTLYSYSANGEFYNFSTYSTTSSFREAVLNRFDCLIQLLNWYCNHFFNWYYPLDSSAPYYWRYYNTDTELQESIGLAGLWYNISWYLGEIYQNLTDAGSDMTQDAQSLGSSISALNTAEESVNTQIQSAFSTVSGIMTLPVISAAALCISWIEYMWGSLGIFQSPTLLAYMCVILMMLVGFAKYRSAFR